MPETFELETRDGIRKVEFDPDVFRFRDVRILVDGKRSTEMPYPKAGTPYHEAVFDVGDHRLVAVAHLTAIPDPAEPLGVHYDLFADGRSLTDGTPLADARKAAPAPGEAYPGAFRVVDMILRVTPAASASGLAIGVTRGGGGLAWPWPAMIGLVVLMLGALGLATWLAARAWTRIRADRTRSVLARTAIGLGAVIGSYLVGLVGVLGLAVVIGQAIR